MAHREVLKGFGFTDEETTDNAILALFGNIHVGDTLGIERFTKDEKQYTDLEVWDLIKSRARELLVEHPMDPLLIKGLREAKRQGVRLSVWSSSPSEILDESIRMNGLEDLFDAVVSVDDVDSDKHKPDPQGLLMAVKAMDVASGYLDEGEEYSDEKPLSMNGVWMIGDSPNDILAGKSVGASTVWIEHPLQGHNAHEKRLAMLEKLQRKLGDYAISDDLRAMIERIRATVTIRVFDPEEAGYSRNISILDIDPAILTDLTPIYINIVKFLLDKNGRSQAYRDEAVRNAITAQGIVEHVDSKNLDVLYHGGSTGTPRRISPRKVVKETKETAPASMNRIAEKLATSGRFI